METPNKTTDQPVEKTEVTPAQEWILAGSLTFHFHYRAKGVNYTVNVKAKNLNEALVSFAQVIEGVEEIYKVVQKTDL